jgi:hypothetical protein
MRPPGLAFLPVGHGVALSCSAPPQPSARRRINSSSPRRRLVLVPLTSLSFILSWVSPGPAVALCSIISLNCMPFPCPSLVFRPQIVPSFPPPHIFHSARLGPMLFSHRSPFEKAQVAQLDLGSTLSFACAERSKITTLHDTYETPLARPCMPS